MYKFKIIFFFIIVSFLIIFLPTQTVLNKTTILGNYNNFKNNNDDDFVNFLKFLNKKNLFLIDLNKLKDISAYENSTNLELNFYKFLNQDSILFFGLFQNDVEKLSQVYIN
jgi:hypothetical protein